jgi:hypothetical protein
MLPSENISSEKSLLMRKAILWFLTAQKFIFTFIALFGSIPLIYALSDTIFDQGLFIIITGIILYALITIPLVFAIILGYDRLTSKLKDKKEEVQRPKMSPKEKANIAFSVKEEVSKDKGIEELTLTEVDMTENKRASNAQ